MELPLKIESVLKVDNQGFLSCSGKDYALLFRQHHQKDAIKLLQNILDGMGALSAKAQALKQVITNNIRFLGSQHRIYIKVKENKALGFLKVGQKNLFYRDFTGNIKQLKPTCVLDFYVHQSCQRSGIGKEIFQKFLAIENRTPERLAYDRPSQKLIGFLKKHYGLAKYIPQNNNYVIFDKYFDKNSTTKAEHHERPKSYIPVQKVQETTSFKPAHYDMEPPNKRQFTVQMHSTFQARTNKHKNTTSQGNPFSLPLGENPAFRTSSNAYGSYYRHK